MSRSFFRGAVVGLLCAVVGGAAVALAGNGVGAVFNLGQTNTVNAQSTLTGSTNNPQLQVTNTNTNSDAYGVSARASSAAAVRGINSSGTGVVGSSASGVGMFGQSASSTQPGIKGQNTGSGPAGVFSSAGTALNASSTSGVGVFGQSASSTQPGIKGQNTGGGPAGVFSSAGTGVDASSTGSFTIAVKGSNNTNPGYGVWGESKQGTGVYGSGGDHGGFFTSPGVGLEGTSTGNDGVRGGTTASDKSGVWGHHDGAKTIGYGVFASSDKGSALALGQPSANTAAPVILNGQPFPQASDGWKLEIPLPADNDVHTVASLAVDPGSYLLIAKGTVLGEDSGPLPLTDTVRCYLFPDAFTGSSESDLRDDAVVDATGENYGNFSLTLFHTFATSGHAVLACNTGTDPGVPAPSINRIRLVAVKISGGTTEALP